MSIRRLGSLSASVLAILFAAAAALLAEQGISSAGLKWTIPAGWASQPARQMRVATYSVPAAKDLEAGECGVFYFGAGKGGSAEENIARWGAQFEGGSKPTSVVETVGGMKVHRVQAAGAYLAPSGPMMQSSGKKPGYRLLGAIVEAPEGLVFFKCTGPAATIAANEKAFDGMVRSFEKIKAAKF
jgi:hypothetical protein